MLLGAYALDKLDGVIVRVDTLEKKMADIENMIKTLDAKIETLNKKFNAIPDILDNLEP